VSEETLKYADLLSLEGRVAVVTGGATGIGAALVRRFVEAGARCLVAGLSWAAEELADLGDKVVHTVLDVRDPEAMEATARRCVDELGSLDIWVNNAGIFPQLDPLVRDEDTQRAVVDVNLVAVERGMQIAAEHMRAQGRGVILNVASTAAFRGAGTYSATKWAVRGMTAGFAPVVSPFGVRVVAVAPTATPTAGLAAYAGGGEVGRDLVDTVMRRIPLGRLGTPDDIARAGLFLVSDAASFVTGQTLVVDGGSLTAMPS